MDAVIKARGDKAALNSEQVKKVRLSELRADYQHVQHGWRTDFNARRPRSGRTAYPDQLGFDHMESFFIGVEAKPSESFRANVSFNVLGNVATNPINEIFYENRGRPQTAQSLNPATNQIQTIPLGCRTFQSISGRYQLERQTFRPKRLSTAPGITIGVMKATSSAFTPKPTTAPILTFTTAKRRSVLKCRAKRRSKILKWHLAHNCGGAPTRQSWRNTAGKSANLT
jgi:hypothetical protein